ncbi:hypothetical protein [Kitasatospora sp. NE20-6]|uniref:hypothetical protein n=1 Tax=Kitasatospora sp. NE20-6 TaxID=2859066 RepID=UPI0038B25DA2
MAYDTVPSAVFTRPRIAQAGLTEQETRAQGIDYAVRSSGRGAGGGVHGRGPSQARASSTTAGSQSSTDEKRNPRRAARPVSIA